MYKSISYQRKIKYSIDELFELRINYMFYAMIVSNDLNVSFTIRHVGFISSFLLDLCVYMQLYLYRFSS